LSFPGGMMNTYLLEIGTEEIPASFINKITAYFKEETKKQFDGKNIEYSQILSDGTPRRLYIYIEGLPDKQKDSETEIMGPPAKIAFDGNGNLTKAGMGFVKSKGLSENSLKKIKTDRGEYLAGIKRTIGVPVKEILPEIINDIINNIPFPKSMRWGNRNIRFARPVHWILSIFNSDILAVNLDDIKAGNITYGHRFMAPKQIQIQSFEDYKNKLTTAKVITDFEERKEIIRKKLNELSKTNSFIIKIDEDLLNTVANLVEFPHPILGEFPKEYLKLPKEALVTSMKYHQKYFYVTDKNGNILNYFVGVSNTVPEDDNVVKNGFERVLNARLSDAMFFYVNDQKVPLDERVEELKKVVYQVKLGTSYEKIIRFKAVAEWLAKKLKPEIYDRVSRAAYICKADLMTEMVYEFAELQGIMGREYAKIAGEHPNVAEAIFEHYLPRFAGDDLPVTDEGAIISIADKIDTICGCFAVNLIPTGNNDPYALRRNSIGILQIIKNKNYRIDLKELINYSLSQLPEKIKFDKSEIARKVYEFILLRFKQILINNNIDADVFDAVANNFSDILILEKVAEALTSIKDSDKFQTISQSYKRISNILKKNNWNQTNYDKSLFETEEEIKLSETLETQLSIIKDRMANEDFDKALEALLNFAEPVNEFFDNVMVMAEDEKIKNNRLGLLAKLKSCYDILGELSKIN
jgi:glycyl-tRNA synthetase beta chain